MWALNSDAIYQQVTLYTGGSTSPHINIGEIINFFVPHPPIEEQQSVSEHIAKSCAYIENCSSNIGESIQKLLEYRLSVITAAVTGGIEGLG